MPDHGRTANPGPGDPPLRLVDVFCGAGGLSEGFRQAGFAVTGGGDVDPDACATFARNFPEAATVCGDIREEAVREQMLQVAADADVIVGGPPCQAFSQVRNHARILDDPRNSLYREFVRLVAVARPRAFLMENVPGMDQMGVRAQIADDLSVDGEYLVHPQLVDAADFGVPQTRRRLLFLGVRRRCGVEPPLLSGTGAAAAVGLVRSDSRRRIHYGVGAVGASPDAERLLQWLADPADARAVTAAQAISDLAGLPVPGRLDEIRAADLPEPSSEYQRRMRSPSETLGNIGVPRINADTRMRLKGVPAGGNHRDLADELRDRYLTGLRWGPDSGSGRLERKHYYAYRRLHPDMWSWTLNTKADSVYHYQGLRALSVREFARLQSFPDSFVITTDARRGELPGRVGGGNGHSRYRQVGNAVPPLLANAIAGRIKDALLRIPAAKLVA